MKTSTTWNSALSNSTARVDLNVFKATEERMLVVVTDVTGSTQFSLETEAAMPAILETLELELDNVIIIHSDAFFEIVSFENGLDDPTWMKIDREKVEGMMAPGVTFSI